MTIRRLRACVALAACCYLFACSPAPAQDAAVAEVDPLAVPATDEGLPGAGPIRRADWFNPLWRQRRGRWAESVAADQGAVVFLGDSITQGWGGSLRPSFPGVKVANRGISGDTTRGMLVRLKGDVLAVKPSGVVLLMGTNDIEVGVTPEVIAGNITEIIKRLKAADARMPIVYCNIMPSSASKSRPKAKIQKVNQLVFDAVKGDKQITVIDTWLLFATREGDAIVEEFPDLLHPNRRGYAKWAAALRPIFATLGYLETEPDDFELEEGFESLFNGHDLTGWGLRPTSKADLESRRSWRASDPSAPEWPVITEDLWFDGKTESPDGRYQAINDRLVVTTPPDGRRITQLWTKQEFPNDFTLRLDFRATPNADSGIYLRGPQLQCRDYSLAGPWKELKNYKPQDWNSIEVKVTGGVAHCTCNGEVLDAEFAVPATGPIGLEGDRGQMEYRRIRIRQSP